MDHAQPQSNPQNNNREAADFETLEEVDRALRKASLSRALHQIVREIHNDEQNAPALARFLARWLDDAHVGDLSEKDDDLSLVRTVRYSDLYYIVPASDKPLRVSGNDLAAIESALDTYKLISDRLGDGAPEATMDDIGRLSEEVRSLAPQRIPETTAVYHPTVFDSKAEAESAFDLPEYNQAMGEWAWRVALSTSLESIRSPHRIVVDFHGELSSGAVSLVSLVPSAASMPRSRWNAETQRFESLNGEERFDMALHYALTCAVSCIAAAFASSDRIMRVNFLEGFFNSEAKTKQDGDENADLSEVFNGSVRGFTLQSCCRISVDRATFMRDDRYLKAASDPLGCWMALGGEVLLNAPVSDMLDGWPDALELLDSQVDAAQFTKRGDFPELADGRLPKILQGLLGSRCIRDMRIAYTARRRNNAEHLADALAASAGDAESIRIARDMQQRASDPFDVEALNRVMSALVVEGLDVNDQNAVVNCYLGEDEYVQALARSRELMREDRTRALGELMALIDGVEAAKTFDDTPEVVYRGFDAYPSRLLYNLIRQGDLVLPASEFDYGRADNGKRVELIPDSLYLCYSTASYVVEQQFDGFERGVELAQRAIRMAPTVPNGYRQLARAYSLVGDMAQAKKVLVAALCVSVSPADVAILYYQLGYVLWKGGDARTGALCYLKSMETSPVVAIQAASELRELMHEASVPVLGRPEIDSALAAAGIPVAPLQRVLDAIMAGAAAATDAGMFSVAQSLLTVGLHYRPDDAFVDVLKSLAER